jgi:membrane protease subunit HflK
MPWNNQTGGNGQGSQEPRGPWGRGPSGGGSGGGIRPPDFEALLRGWWDRLNHLIPGGIFSTSGLAAVGLALIAIWLMSGIYFVTPEEQGVVLRFGAVSGRSGPGVNYHLPWPIEVVYTPQVTTENKISIGYQPADSSGDNAQATDVPEESHMLTGDENIVDVNFTVYWKIKDAAAFLFNVAKPPDAIKAVAESAMREVVGENQIESIQTSEREQMQVKVRELMQKTLDAYGIGVVITRVQMQKADPPLEVIAAYRDVQAARADQDRKRSEAEAYANRIIPQARGQAAHIVQDAEAYRQQVIALSSGEAKRFLSVYEQYRKAPDVTRKRMYLETMTQVLAPMNKVIVDDGVKGVVPYFQLPALQKTLAQPNPSSTQQGGAAPAPQASSADQGSNQGGGQ